MVGSNARCRAMKGRANVIDEMHREVQSYVLGLAAEHLVAV